MEPLRTIFGRPFSRFGQGGIRAYREGGYRDDVRPTGQITHNIGQSPRTLSGTVGKRAERPEFVVKWRYFAHRWSYSSGINDQAAADPSDGRAAAM
jgi:hypothetical protein